METSPSESRARERDRRIVYSGISAILFRGVSLFVSMATVSLALGHLGKERYGLWLALTSVVALLPFADLGLGNGLVNLLARARAHDEIQKQRELVSSAFLTLTLISLALGVVFSMLYQHVNWPRLFNVNGPTAMREAGPAFASLVLCFLAGFPILLGQKIHMACQEVFLANTWSSIGSLLGLLGLIVGIKANMGLPELVLLVGMGPLLAGLVNLVFIARRRPELRPRLGSASGIAARRIMNVGSLFLILGIAGAVAYQSDNIIIARMMGPQHVPELAIPFKLFFIVPTLLGLALVSLWPAYGEAITRGDAQWIRKTLLRSIAVATTVNLASGGALLLVGPDLIQVWVGTTIEPTLLLMVGLAVWAIFSGISGPIAAFLNGANVLGFQVLTSLTMMTANIGLSIILVRSLGVAGPVFGSILAQLLFILIPCGWYIPRLLRRLDGGLGRSQIK